VPESPPAIVESAIFAAEVERVRQSGQLGRGTQMQRLFEFLVTCQAHGRVPKELEIAVDGFGRGADFDVAQDATVRVTVHKLRRRLDDFYREEGAAAPYRLTLPRGEYRLTLESMAAAAETLAREDQRGSWPPRERTAWLVAGLLAGLCLVLVVALLRRADVDDRVARVRESPLWAPLLEDGLPIQLVLGDYYIFGETDGSGAVRRLIRDFDVNSQQDLEQRFIADPGLAAQFADLNLGYLPTSSAQALREVLPVVTAAGKRVTLTLASELDPSTVKTTHVVYIGYLSALGMLEEMVFGGSRYAFGGSYDEIIDGETGRMWVSDAGEPHSGTERYTDYAYVASVTGPGDVRHLVIAGTRDTGLMQAAENLAAPDALQEIARGSPTWSGFEALYEVHGVNGVNVESRLVGVNSTRAARPAP
jgi:anti-sigma-K factor RskA